MPEVSEQAEAQALEDVREKYADALREGMRYSIGKLDDQILYISSGALAISLTFIKDIVPLQQAVWLILLFLSWLMLTVCVGLSLYSHLHSYQEHQKQLERLENNLDLKEDKSTDWINKTNTILLILGIVLQVSFASINIYLMPEQATNPPTASPQQTIQIIAPDTGEKLGLPVAKTPKELKPAADTSATKGKK